jgi:hypothetical protein
MQREYVDAWDGQLTLLEELQKQAPALRDDTVILLLDVPAGAFDVRFHYPLTQLVRRFYANPTLHVLPWQQGFSPNEQLVAFGKRQIAATVDITRRQMRSFDYDRLIAFKVEADGSLRATKEIDSRYLYAGTSERLPFEVPEGWTPARRPIVLTDGHKHTVADTPPDTPWRRWLLSQLDSPAVSKLSK